MEANLVNFLSSLSSTVFRLAAICFVLVNTAAIVAFATSKSRHLVDAWTKRIVTIDVVLVGSTPAPAAAIRKRDSAA